MTRSRFFMIVALTTGTGHRTRHCPDDSGEGTDHRKTSAQRSAGGCPGNGGG